mgnify:CR=1 FL=1
MKSAMQMAVVAAVFDVTMVSHQALTANWPLISNSDRPSDYGIEIYQGNKTDLFYNQLTISYLFNPRTNLKIEGGYVYRMLEDDYGIDHKNFIFFALKSDLFNRYYDF